MRYEGSSEFLFYTLETSNFCRNSCSSPKCKPLQWTIFRSPLFSATILWLLLPLHCPTTAHWKHWHLVPMAVPKKCYFYFFFPNSIVFQNFGANLKIITYTPSNSQQTKFIALVKLSSVSIVLSIQFGLQSNPFMFSRSFTHHPPSHMFAASLCL